MSVQGPRLFVTRDNAQGRFLAHALSIQIPDLHLMIEESVEGSLKKVKAQLRRHFKRNPLSALLYLFELPVLALIDIKEQAQVKRELVAPKGFPLKLKVRRVPHVNSQEAWEFLGEVSPCSTVVYGSSIIGKTSLLNMGKVLNCHMGIVPQYRGAKSEFWAIRNKDKDNLGFSIHECVQKLDAGHLIEQARLPLNGNAASMRATSLKVLSETLPKVWNEYLAGKSCPIEQIGEVNYYSTPRLWDRLTVLMRR
jgi:methionyl-tRNA formyltransferase